MDLTLFLSKFLSGKGDVTITPGARGYSMSAEKVGSRTVYTIHVPTWEDYNLPLDPEDKWRIYRSGVWHESMHAKYTPEEVIKIGSVNNRVVDPLEHDVANIIEDRRIEDLGSKYWKGYVSERLFSNGYAWSQRMDVGDFWKTYLNQWFDPNTGNYDPAAQSFLKPRLAHMRHEAVLQRLITGKIKGGREIPIQEREKIEKAAEQVESELDRLDPEDLDRVYRTVADLTSKVIRDLELHHWKPDITQLGEDSWDQSFREDHVAHGKQETRAGIDDYFDELMTVEVICEKCGQHYVKKYGLRGEEGQRFKEAVKAMGERRSQ
jgi:hypothetical protein